MGKTVCSYSNVSNVFCIQICSWAVCNSFLVSDYVAETVFQTENFCFLSFTVPGLVDEIPSVTFRFQIIEIFKLKI